jgi:hypothetical protein
MINNIDTDFKNLSICQSQTMNYISDLEKKEI